MANVLLLVHRIPYPPTKGDKVRSFHLLRHLQRRHRVFLGTFVDHPGDERFVPALRALCPDVHVSRLDRGRARVRSLRGLLRHEPLTLGYYADTAMADWVQSVVREHQLDATVVFCTSMAQYAPPALPMLIDFVDLDSAKWAQFAAVRRQPLSWLYRREGRLLLDYERHLARVAAGVFFTTTAEVALFESAAPEARGQAQVLRNGVDAEYFAPTGDRVSPFPSNELPVVFTGSMDYWPNVDAVTWFAREMLPTLRQRWPRLRFYIVGRDPASAVHALAGDAVVVTGSVDDVRPYLEHAVLAVAPMRFSRGVQNKILEAMAMKRVVVATDSCAKAVGAGVNDGLLGASDAEAFVAAVSEHLQRPLDRAFAAGQAARDFVQKHYRWDATFGPLDACLSESRAEGTAPC